MKELWVRVNGTPVPQGSKSARVLNGRAIMYEANPALKAWRREVTNAGLRATAHADTMFPGAVSVTVWAYFTKPRTSKRLQPVGKPDIDKVARAILDGLTDAALWIDDSYVVELSIRKDWVDGISEVPHVKIHITEAYNVE